MQLQAYAVAAAEVDLGVDKPDEIDVTFAYLGGGLDVHTEHADEEWRQDAARNLEVLTAGIEDERFEAVPGDWCHSCDFLRFCAEGKSEVGE